MNDPVEFARMKTLSRSKHENSGSSISNHRIILNLIIDQEFVWKITGVVGGHLGGSKSWDAAAGGRLGG